MIQKYLCSSTTDLNALYAFEANIANKNWIILCGIPEAFSPICTSFYSYAEPLSIRQNSLEIYLLWMPWVETALENSGWLSTRPETSRHLTQEGIEETVTNFSKDQLAEQV